MRKLSILLIILLAGLLVNYFFGANLFDVKNVVVDKELFTKMCKDGCPNFDKKFSRCHLLNHLNQHLEIRVLQGRC